MIILNLNESNLLMESSIFEIFCFILFFIDYFLCL